MKVEFFKSHIIRNTTYTVSNIFFKNLTENFKNFSNELKNIRNLDNIKIIYISNFKKLNISEFKTLLNNKFINSIEIHTTKNKIYKLKNTNKKPSSVFFIIELNSNCRIKDGSIINKKIYNFIKKSKKNKLHIGFNYENTNYFANIMTTSKGLNDDIANILISNLFDTKYDKYTYIYDKVCEKLDQNFIINNFCDFKDNKCVANRDSNNIERDNGCCHSFIRNKNIGHSNTTEELTLCKYLGEDKACTIKSISCKFFVCQYLKSKGIYFDILDNFLLRAIFNKKQFDVIHINFFKTEDEIVKKLIKVEHNPLPYRLYILLRMQLIDNYWKKIPEKK